MIWEVDPDLNTCLSKLLNKNKPKQQNKTFCFPTLESPDKTEDHIPIQTRILRELRKLEKKEKLSPKDDADSQMKFLERFDWRATLLIKLRNREWMTF